MKGTMLMYWRSGGTPLVIGTISVNTVWNRSAYATMNADTPRRASESTYSVTSRRLCRLSMDERFHLVAEARAPESFGVRANHAGIERSVDRARDGVGKRVDRRIGDERAGLAVDHRLAGAAAA